MFVLVFVLVVGFVGLSGVVWRLAPFLRRAGLPPLTPPLPSPPPKQKDTPPPAKALTPTIQRAASLTPGTAIKSMPPNSLSLKSTCGASSSESSAPPMHGIVSTKDSVTRASTLYCTSETCW